MKFIIYAIKNIISGKSYIGSTSNFIKRKSGHLSGLRKHRHHSFILQRAYDKYGESAFRFIILEELNDSNVNAAFAREQKYLDYFKPAYNVSRKADVPTRLGSKNSPSHNKKIGEANKGIHKHPQLHHNKNSNGPRSTETREKTKTALKKWWLTPKGLHRRKSLHENPVCKTVLRKTECVICHKEIIYKTKGKVPRTCGTEHLLEWRRRLLNKRREKNPEIFISKKQPPKKTNCIICHKEISYKGKRPLTCSPECLGKRKQQIYAERLKSNPDFCKEASMKRWRRRKMSNKLKIVEGVAGVWHYHLSTTGENYKPALCGKVEVMRTEIPLKAWGTKGHLNETYCKECEQLAGKKLKPKETK